MHRQAFFGGVSIVVLLVALRPIGGAAQDQTPSPTARASAVAAPGASDALSGLRSLAGKVVGAGSHPGYAVEVPEGWSIDDGRFIIKQGPIVMGISAWDVGQVPRDPCQWSSTLEDPGPSIGDLVAALVAQAQRDASEPTDVLLAGYPGRYLEWSVPEDAVVTGDGDFEGCDVQEGHADFVSWFGDGYGERWQQVAGQVDRLWVVDIDGDRLVIDATYSPDATDVDRAELERVVASLRFESHQD
jgi:hypothetical protein